MDYSFRKIIMEQNSTIHPRRKSREATMQALYALEISNGFPEDVLELCDDSFNNSENSQPYAPAFIFIAPPTVPGMPIKNSALDSELSLKNLESLGKKTEEPTFISKLSDNVNSSNLGVSTLP